LGTKFTFCYAVHDSATKSLEPHAATLWVDVCSTF